MPPERVQAINLRMFGTSRTMRPGRALYRNELDVSPKSALPEWNHVHCLRQRYMRNRHLRRNQRKLHRRRPPTGWQSMQNAGRPVRKAGIVQRYERDVPYDIVLPTIGSPVQSRDVFLPKTRKMFRLVRSLSGEPGSAGRDSVRFWGEPEPHFLPGSNHLRRN
jgi:hypothetical protein